MTVHRGLGKYTYTQRLAIIVYKRKKKRNRRSTEIGERKVGRVRLWVAFNSLQSKSSEIYLRCYRMFSRHVHRRAYSVSIGFHWSCWLPDRVLTIRIERATVVSGNKKNQVGVPSPSQTRALGTILRPCTPDDDDDDRIRRTYNRDA